MIWFFVLYFPMASDLEPLLTWFLIICIVLLPFLEAPEATLDSQSDLLQAENPLMKIKLVEVLTLNEEVARTRNAQIQALYAEQEDVSPKLKDPSQQQGQCSVDAMAARQRFRRFCFEEAAGPQDALIQLQELCHQWLQPEIHSKEQILEQLVLEQFLAVLPEKLRMWVESQHPENCQAAVALVEDVNWVSEEEGEYNVRARPEVGEAQRGPASSSSHM